MQELGLIDLLRLLDEGATEVRVSDNKKSLEDFRKWLVHRAERENTLGNEATEFNHLDNGRASTVHYQQSATLQRVLTNYDLAMLGSFTIE